jgi:excinuclease ABC subunit B
VTDSMKRTIDETTRRRAIQEAYNKEHGITPTGINRAVEASMKTEEMLGQEAQRAKLDLKKIPKDEYGSLLKDLNSQMELAAANLQFEQAAELRDLIAQIKAEQ